MSTGTSQGLAHLQSPLLPSENPAAFEDFRAGAYNRFDPRNADDFSIVDQYIDVSWRILRSGRLESSLITIELKRMQIASRTDAALAELMTGLDQSTLEALAVERLNQSKSLIEIHRQEQRLARRLKQLRPDLELLESFATTRRLKAYETAQAELEPNTPTATISDSPIESTPLPRPRQYKSAA